MMRTPFCGHTYIHSSRRGRRWAYLFVVEDGADDADVSVGPESVEGPFGWGSVGSRDGDECDVSPVLCWRNQRWIGGLGERGLLVGSDEEVEIGAGGGWGGDEVVGDPGALLGVHGRGSDVDV